jgi:DNA-binding CsgD family transcriptional regulator
VGGATAVRGDDLLSTIEAIHAAGLDSAHWPDALAAIAQAVGGNAASLEIFDQQTLLPRAMHSYGLPRAQEIEYLEHYAQFNIRLPFVSRQKLEELSWDYLFFDEPALNRAPFYMEFMPRMDIRYFVSGIVLKTDTEFAGVCVHRSPRMGHIQRTGIAAMRILVPHVRQALDVARRLRYAGETRQSLERTLDWLADGVALLRTDGAVIYANESFQAIARRNDGIRLRKNAVEFDDAAAREKFQHAIAATLRLKAGDADATANDFVAPRATGERPYLVSVRPLLGRGGPRQPAQAAAIVFVRDPLAHGTAAAGTLRELFGLTEAEAALAQALQSGVTLTDYARRRELSLNTVYTHLRHLREKTGCSRMAELIHKLNELHSPLRSG